MLSSALPHVWYLKSVITARGAMIILTRHSPLYFSPRILSILGWKGFSKYTTRLTVLLLMLGSSATCAASLVAAC